RFIVLIGGPALLIAGSYALSFPGSRPGRTARAAQVAEAERRSLEARVEGDRSLAAACARAADQLSASLPESSHVLLRPPFVVAGNLAEKDLERLHHRAVLPAVAALWRSYFDHKPDQPVTIVLLRDEASYHAAAMSLDGYEPRAYAGYTQ